MKNRILAKRYAKALFSLADFNSPSGFASLQAYAKNLAGLDHALQVSPQLCKVLQDPVVTLFKKKQILKQLLSLMQADVSMANFCYLLADHNRLSLLSEIASSFDKLLDQAQNIVRGQVITAIELTEQRQNEMRTVLAGKSSAQLVLDFVVDPQIIGGLVVRLGDQVLDASLRATLLDLRRTLSQVA